MKLEFSYISEKYSSIKFHENTSSESRIVSRGQTDIRRDMRKLIVVFRNVKKALKTGISYV